MNKILRDLGVRTPGMRALLLIGAMPFYLGAPAMLTAQSTEPPAVAAVSLAQDISRDDLVIAPGDLLTITVFDTPEFSGPVRVSNRGTVELPLIGSVTVAGISPAAAANLIRERLMEGNFLKDPQVTISLSDFSNHSAVILGEVGHPGPMALTGLRTLWEVIGAAGGASPTAGEKITIVHKEASAAPEVFDIDWGRDLTGQPNPIILPGDTIQVSRAGVVYVVGQVTRQGAYPITHQRLTVSQVIALSEGVKYTSKAAHARLVRFTASSRTIQDIDIPAMLQGKKPDLELQDRDIVYVPNSASKVVIARGLEAAIGISTSLIVLKQTR